VMDDLKSGTTYAVSFDGGVTSNLFTSRKTISSIEAITLATQTTTNNASVLSGRTGLSLVIKIGSTTATVDFSGNAATIQAAMASAFGTTVSVVVGDSSVSFSTTGTVVSISPTIANFNVTGSGGNYTVSATGVATAATSVIAPGTNPSSRNFAVTSHGMAVGQRIAFWSGDVVVARSIILSVADANTFAVRLADVDGANFTASHCAVTSTRYINGLKYCSSRITQTFYLPGVTTGIATPVDIPQPDVIMSAQGWLDAIVAGSAYATVQVSSLASWKGSIYAQEVTDLQMADAIETI